MSRLHEIEPRRWADDPDAGVLRELLQGARGDLPEPPALDALAAKLGIDAAPPGATGSSAGAATTNETASRPARSPARPEATSDAPWWTAGGPLRPAVGLLAAAAAVGLVFSVADRRADPTTARSSSPALRPAPADELLPLDTPGAPDAPKAPASPAADDVVSRPAGAPAVGKGAGRTEGNAPARDDGAAAPATPAPELARSPRPGDPAPRRAAPSSPPGRPTADTAPPPAGERRADPGQASSPAPAAPDAADGLAAGPGSDPAADDGAAGAPSSAPQDLRPSSPAAPSELALIRTMRDALRGGSPFVALQAVATHAEVYPDGSLTEERRSYQIRALAAAGRREDARRLAAAFRRDYPSSVHADAIDDALRR